MNNVEELKSASLIKTVMTTEVKFIIGIITVVLGVVAPFYSIKQDVALIKQNHLAHMEAYSKELARIATEQEKQQETIIKLMQEIARME